LGADLAKSVEHYLQVYVFFLKVILDGFLWLLDINQQNLKRFILITLLKALK
jgi:hypothetical protein